MANGQRAADGRPAGQRPERVDAAAIILAGGSSSRMGQEKSMLLVHGRPLIERIRDQLQPLFPAIIVSANDPERYAFLELPVVPDAVAGQGPLMGIASALRASPYDCNLVVACDIPRMNLSLIRQLLALSGGNDAVVPRTSAGHLEPLFAVYRKSILPAMDAALASGRRKIIDAFGSARVHTLDIAGPAELQNLNTPEDYAGFLNGAGGEQ